MDPERIRSHTFPNGLALVAETMPHVRSAAFTLLIPAGAAREPAGKGGLAAMTAEWIARGAGDLDSRALIETLDGLGINHSESASALHASISASTLAATLPRALEIFADVALRPRLDSEEVEPIRELTIQGLRSLEDDPGSFAMLELRRQFFPEPWGRPASGTNTGLRSATERDLREFWSRHYRPGGAILAVAGAIDWAELKDTVERLFGGWEPQAPPPLDEGPRGSRRTHIAKETQQTQIGLAFPSVKVSDPAFYQARAAAMILGGYSSSRLFTEVREKRGLCYAVSAGYEGLKDQTAIICYAGTTPERAQQTLDITLAELRRLREEGVTEEELDAMRAGLKTSLIMQQESTTSRSGALAADWFHLGRIRSLDEISRALDGLTPASVSAHARTWPLEELTILTLGPAPLAMPPEA